MRTDIDVSTENSVFEQYLRRPSRRRLARVVDLFHTHVWRVALRVTGNEGDALDITQDVFLGLLLRPPSPEGVRSAEGYLASRVLTLARRLRRASRRRIEREREAVRRSVRNPAIAPEDVEEVLAQVDALPKSVREFLELRYLGGLRNREIAELEGVSERTVEETLRRGRDAIRRRLGASSLGALAALEGLAVTEAPPAPPGLLARLRRVIEMGDALECVVPGATVGLGALAMKKVTVSLVCGLLLALAAGGLYVSRSPDSPSEATREEAATIPGAVGAARTNPNAVLERERAATGSAVPAGLASQDASGATLEATLAGRVVDGDERPVPDAWVGLYEPDEALAAPGYEFLGMKRIFPERTQETDDELTVRGMRLVAETTTDADGRFAFTPAWTLAGFHLRGEGAEGYASGFEGPFRSGRDDVLLRLRASGSIAGVVVDAETRLPLAGARLELRNERFRVRATSGHDGRFDLGLVPDGSYDLEILHHDYDRAHEREVSVPLETPQLVVTMQNATEGTWVTGTVTDAGTGQPVAGAIITAKRRHRTLSSTSGSYRLRVDPVEKGHMDDINARARGYGIADAQLRGGEEPYEIDFTLEPARPLRCQVVRGDVPAAGARVSLWVDYSTRYFQQADGEGFCTFFEVPVKGNVDFFAFHPELGRAIEKDVPVDGQDSEDEGTVLLIELEKPSAKVVALVRDIEGSPVANANVLILDALGDKGDWVIRHLDQAVVLGANMGKFGNLRVARTDATGKTVFPDTFAGECVLQALGENFPVDRYARFRTRPYARSVPSLITTPESGIAECELVLWHPLTIGGKVTTPIGRAMSYVKIALLEFGEDGEWELVNYCFTNERGNYRFSGIDPVERHAVAVVPMTPEEARFSERVISAWEARDDGADEEERFLTMTRFTSDGRPKPKDFSVFAEVPHDATAREAIVDLTVELSEGTDKE